MLIARCKRINLSIMQINGKDMGAQIGVLVRSVVATVEIEGAKILILIIITTAIQNDAGSVVVRVVARNR